MHLTPPQPAHPHAPAKSIPPARDRLQSRLLIAVAIPTFCYLSYLAIRYANTAGHTGRIYLSLAAAISLFFAFGAWRLRAATPLAAICGGLICFAITILSGRPNGPSPLHSGLTPLVLLFILTFEATRIHRNWTPIGVPAEDRQGRNAAQIVANLGIATLASAYFYSFFGHVPHGSKGPYILAALQVTMLAALAEATADTVSSEIGQVFGGTPILLTTLRRVPPGTDGALSLIGTLAGIAAAAIVAISGAPSIGMSIRECLIAFAAATAGLFFDSLLGATLERRGYLGNDLVNFLSTAFAAAVAFVYANAIM